MKTRSFWYLIIQSKSLNLSQYLFSSVHVLMTTLRLIIGSKHWMLVAIDPYNNRAYYMDSMSKKLPLNLKESVKL